MSPAQTVIDEIKRKCLKTFKSAFWMCKISWIKIADWIWWRFVMNTIVLPLKNDFILQYCFLPIYRYLKLILPIQLLIWGENEFCVWKILVTLWDNYLWKRLMIFWCKFIPQVENICQPSNSVWLSLRHGTSGKTLSTWLSASLF